MSGKPRSGPRVPRDPKIPKTYWDLPIDEDGFTAKDRWNYSQRCKRAERLGLPKPPMPGGAWKDYGIDPGPFGLVVQNPPDDELTAEEIIARRKSEFRKKKEYEDGRKLLRARVTKEGPIGILHLGDPHVDDESCDWEQLEAHVNLIKRTDCLFAANVGDVQNNWIGRLSRLYSSQTVTAKQSWRLAEWLVNELAGKWLYMIAGNHDLWSGDGDPMQWIARQNAALYESSEVRVQILFPKGAPIVVNARHDFNGHSQYNPAHGPARAAIFGVRDDIMIAGHKHKSGYSPIKDPETGKVCHCIQIASYKVYDRYAREKGLRDQSFGPAVLTVVDPEDPNPLNRVQVFWDPFKGADYLNYLRERRGAA